MNTFCLLFFQDTKSTLKKTYIKMNSATLSDFFFGNLEKFWLDHNINVLCDLTKQHCSLCEWEQECSDNPLLFDPVFVRRYINERNNWFFNKQSMCTKCKLQLGEHLISHNTQNAANTISDSSDSLQY